MREILMPHGKIKILTEQMGVSNPTITKALRGQSSSLLSMRIREKALALGGVEVTEDEHGRKQLVE